MRVGHCGAALQIDAEDVEVWLEEKDSQSGNAVPFIDGRMSL